MIPTDREVVALPFDAAGLPRVLLKLAIGGCATFFLTGSSAQTDPSGVQAAGHRTGGLVRSRRHAVPRTPAV